MFVVFVQAIDKSHRIKDVIGPFRSHKVAQDYIRTMREDGKMYADDNYYWLGIRHLISQSEARKIGA